jgi:hypothetical protein
MSPVCTAPPCRSELVREAFKKFDPTYRIQPRQQVVSYRARGDQKQQHSCRALTRRRTPVAGKPRSNGKSQAKRNPE